MYVNPSHMSVAPHQSRQFFKHRRYINKLMAFRVTNIFGYTFVSTSMTFCAVLRVFTEYSANYKALSGALSCVGVAVGLHHSSSSSSLFDIGPLFLCCWAKTTTVHRIHIPYVVILWRRTRRCSERYDTTQPHITQYA